jgi:sugar O-acyltransferase (sialic acid O-acetyltransferase NeuD family)
MTAPDARRESNVQTNSESPAGGPLVIVGNGETAVLAYEYFSLDSPWNVVGFCIGEQYIKEPTLYGLPVFPLQEMSHRFPPETHQAFVAIGDARLNRVRTEHVAQARAAGYKLASYVSSKAFRWHNVEIGDNCFILENNVLQPFVTIGNNVTLWSGNHIGHRSVIEDNVFITSHVVISGFCRVGAYSFIGVNAAVAHLTKIAADNFIAMGAAITRSTEPDTIYQGVPAEPRKIAATRFCKV